MNKDLLIETGQALYGEQWQSELARTLDVSDRTVRRWLDGSRGIPADLPLRLVPILEERVATLRERLKELKR
jgi:plasmid maintenance system antidote protein VapI